MSNQSETSGSLKAWCAGDDRALAGLLEDYYAKWIHLAERVISKQGMTGVAEPADLVHRVYLSLVDWRTRTFEDLPSFWGFLQGRMSRVLIDLIRKNQAQKRGGGSEAIPEQAWSAWLEGINPGGEK